MLRQAVLIATLSALPALPGFAAEWTIDSQHSTLGFEIRHLVVSKATGRFTDFSGSIIFDGRDVRDGSVEITVKTASVDTDNEDRDKHLSSDDFLDAERFPAMTFKSTKIGEVKDGRFTMTGELTIKDVTREAAFDCEFNGVLEKDMRGNSRAGFSAEATINRQDYHVSWNRVLDAGGLALGNDVKLRIEIEAILKTDKDSNEDDK